VETGCNDHPIKHCSADSAERRRHVHGHIWVGFSGKGGGRAERGSCLDTLQVVGRGCKKGATSFNLQLPIIQDF